MSNRTNHRRGGRKERRTEGRLAHSCAGEGRNGARGRRRWKLLSRRAERRAGGKGLPGIKKLKGRPVFNDPLVE